jgi:hypothetical protein
MEAAYDAERLMCGIARKNWQVKEQLLFVEVFRCISNPCFEHFQGIGIYITPIETNQQNQAYN